jgi:hypothetical protein
MKRFWKIATGVTLAAMLAMFGSPVAHADHDRKDRGKSNDRTAAIVAGIATVGLIAALASRDSAVSVSYHAPRCSPPPPRQVWVPGHYQTVREKVCRPGYWETVRTPAEYGWVRHGCSWHYVLVKPACTTRVWVPERCEFIEKHVWVPGHFKPVTYARAY